MNHVIDGYISDKHENKKDIIYDTYGKLGFAYSTFRDSNPKVYLKSLPSFESIYNYFMSCRICFLKLNKQQDLCLSLFYNPYFDAFYNRLKKDIKNIVENRKTFLKKYLLSYLADPNYYKAIIDFNMDSKDYYLTHAVYERSNELLLLLK